MLRVLEFLLQYPARRTAAKPSGERKNYIRHVCTGPDLRQAPVSVALDLFYWSLDCPLSGGYGLAHR